MASKKAFWVLLSANAHGRRMLMSKHAFCCSNFGSQSFLKTKFFTISHRALSHNQQTVDNPQNTEEEANDGKYYTYKVTNDPQEWKYVEAILPENTTVVPPPPPQALANYPTPSGWLPQQEEKYSQLPYYISRTKNHMLPVYIRQSDKTPVKYTHVGKISGDIWALDDEIKEHLFSLAKVDTDDPDPILTQVHEPGRYIRIRGVFTDEIAQFLLDKGF